MNLNFFNHYLEMFRFHKWFFHDITLIIVLVIGVLIIISMLYFIIKNIINQKNDDGNNKSIDPKHILITFTRFTIIFGIILFIFINFSLFSFGGGASRNNMDLASKGFHYDLGKKEIVVNKWQKSILNKSTDNVSSSISYFQISAVNPSTGEILWINRSNRHEVILGESSKGILVLNKNKSTLKLLDKKDGEKILTEKTFPSMENNWSKKQKDYRMLGNNLLYIYGVDKQYYQINLSSFRIEKNPSYKNMFLIDNSELLKLVEKDGLSLINISAWIDKEKNSLTNSTLSVNNMSDELKSNILNGNILLNEPSPEGVIYVLHSKTKQLSSNAILSAIKLDTQNTLWSTSLNSELKTNSPKNKFVELTEKNLIFDNNGYLYSIDRESGEIGSIYDHSYNYKVNKKD